jgi:hypothetical protein
VAGTARSRLLIWPLLTATSAVSPVHERRQRRLQDSVALTAKDDGAGPREDGDVLPRISVVDDDVGTRVLGDPRCAEDLSGAPAGGRDDVGRGDARPGDLRELSEPWGMVPPASEPMSSGTPAA